VTVTGDGTTPGAELADCRAARRPPWLSFVVDAAVGLLGGLVGLGGLGGAEFRLPRLVGLFGFVSLQAVFVNKAMTLVAVLVALPSRLIAVSPDVVATHWFVAVSQLLGSPPGVGRRVLGDPDADRDPLPRPRRAAARSAGPGSVPRAGRRRTPPRSQRSRG
jgi:hypothetical protein